MTDAGSGAAPYRVLARKYRPRDFSALVGQDALVRTLTNSLLTGRLAQAYMLTGVRGVGKTTTARIVARALNCIGPDGTGGPTPTPCGVCANCVSILEDRHVDVLEMDAASRTGVGDIRELIDSVRYAPVAARSKVYIIDEVHMLSTAAFNALLKTLEEPPPHVTFIFATTEIRKVPITVRSRCIRFDLRRVEPEALTDHFARIAGLEAVEAERPALELIARAADGSVRDGLSLLDQAIAQGDGAVTLGAVQAMLGIADRAAVVDLLEAALTARPDAALAVLARLHGAGAAPLTVLQDLLELTHSLTRLRVLGEAAAGLGGADAFTDGRCLALARGLSMPALTRAWQILLKGVEEVSRAPLPAQALDMVLIRLAFAADLPSPDELVRRLQDGGNLPAAGSNGPGPNGGGGSGPSGSGGGGLQAFARSAMAAGAAAPAVLATARALRVEAVAHAPAPLRAEAAPQLQPATEPGLPAPEEMAEFRRLVALFGENREGLIYGQLVSNVHLLRCQPGRLEFRPGPGAPNDLGQRIGTLLTEWTGQRWMVSIVRAGGAPSLSQQDAAARAARLEEVRHHPFVAALLQAFPGAELKGVETAAEAAAARAAGEADATTELADPDGMPPDDDIPAPDMDELSYLERDFDGV